MLIVAEYPYRKHQQNNALLVLRERIELSTSPLPRECSTTELPQQAGRLERARKDDHFAQATGSLPYATGHRKRRPSRLRDTDP